MALNTLAFLGALWCHSTQSTADYRQQFPLGSANGLEGVGIATAPNVSDSDLQLVQDLGAKYIRTDLQWHVVEKQPGRFEFDDADRLMASATKHNLRMVWILDYGHKAYTGGFKVGPATQEARDAYVRFALAAVRRYQGKGVVWEIWNEPNLSRFWAPKPNVEDTIALFRQTSTAIRNVAPAEWIITGGTSTFDWPYLQAICDSNVLSSFDGLAVHPYRSSNPSSVAEDWQRLRGMVAQSAPRIKLICSEWGYDDEKVVPDGFGAKPMQTVLTSKSVASMGSFYQRPPTKSGQLDPLGQRNAVLVRNRESGSGRLEHRSGFIQTGTLQPGAYRLSAYVKSKGRPFKAMVGLDYGVETPIVIDGTWRKVSKIFVIDKPTTHSFFIFKDEAYVPDWLVAYPLVERVNDMNAREAQFQTQGDQLVEIVRANLGSEISLTILYCLRDQNGEKLGLLDKSGKPKPAFDRLKSFTATQRQ